MMHKRPGQPKSCNKWQVILTVYILFAKELFREQLRIIALEGVQVVPVSVHARMHRPSVIDLLSDGCRCLFRPCYQVAWLPVGCQMVDHQKSHLNAF